MTMLFAQAPSAPPQPDSSAAKFPKASAYANSKLTYKLIDAPKQTYGYDVFADGRLMTHQTSAPALPGSEGFKTKEDAARVALLVIEKMRKGEMPPTISIYPVGLATASHFMLTSCCALAAQIQKVSDQLEVNKPAPQVVNNP